MKISRRRIRVAKPVNVIRNYLAVTSLLAAFLLGLFLLVALERLLLG